MQTIKNVSYEIERVGNSTYCTMKSNLEYILSHLEGAKITPIAYANGIDLKIGNSKEQAVFIKNLASWGFSIDNPVITVVSKITLSEHDKDDQKIANRIARDKAMRTMCKVVSNALTVATKPTYDRLNSIEGIISKLDRIAYQIPYNEEEIPEFDPEDCPDPTDDAVDVADLM